MWLLAYYILSDNLSGVRGLQIVRRCCAGYTAVMWAAVFEAVRGNIRKPVDKAFQAYKGKIGGFSAFFFMGAIVIKDK